MKKDNTTKVTGMSGADGASFAFDVATKLADLYISWQRDKKNTAQMERLIALNNEEIKLLNDIKSYQKWQSSIGLLTKDLLEIQSNFENLTTSYSDAFYNDFARNTEISLSMANTLTKIRDICVTGLTANDSKPLHAEFLDYVQPRDIDHSDQFAVSVYKYYIATLYYQGAFLKKLWFKANGKSKATIDEWVNVAQTQLTEIDTAFDISIKAASPKYKTLENIKSPFKLYTKEQHPDPNPMGDKYYYTLEKPKLALGKALMAGDNQVIIGIKFNKTDVDVNVVNRDFESHGHLGLEITTANITDLINMDQSPDDEALKTETICHKDYTYSEDIDFNIGKSTKSFINQFNRLDSKHVLVGIKLVQHELPLSNALGFELYSREFLVDEGIFKDDVIHHKTQKASLAHVTSFEGLPKSEAEPAQADSRLIQPYTPAVITGVCIIERDHCIQIKLETQDWRSLQ